MVIKNKCSDFFSRTLYIERDFGEFDDTNEQCWDLDKPALLDTVINLHNWQIRVYTYRLTD